MNIYSKESKTVSSTEDYTHSIKFISNLNRFKLISQSCSLVQYVVFNVIPYSQNI